MRQNIECESCAQETKKSMAVRTDDQEHFKTITGDLLTDRRCDLCNRLLPVGSRAVAVSYWFDNRGIAYYPWEHLYINAEGGNDDNTPE